MTKRNHDVYDNQKGARIAKRPHVIESLNQSDQLFSFFRRLTGFAGVARQGPSIGNIGV